MKRILLAGCLHPALMSAQEVRPVYSADYLALIRKDSSGQIITDSSNSMRTAKLLSPGYIYYNNYTVRRIQIGRNNVLQLQGGPQKNILIGGSFSTTAELQRYNRLPSLQQEYAQGRTVNGQLKWQGPETNELFSFGPSLRLLEFDGSPYNYDINGKLVTTGTGNGKPAIAYTNNMLRPASLMANNLILSAKYPSQWGNMIAVGFKTGQTREKIFIQQNRNKSHYYTATADATINKLVLSSQYNFRKEYFDQSNRSGLLNRIYQNSLLTPASFSNEQASRLNTGQRSYSNEANNPFFQLENPEHGFTRKQNTSSVTADIRLNRFRIKTGHAYENKQQISRESLEAGTAFFPAGLNQTRIQLDKNHSLQTTISYNTNFGDYHYTGTASLNYSYAHQHTDIQYGPSHPAYRYQRASHDLSLSFNPVHRGYNHETGAGLVYKFFTSTTSQKNYWLPQVSAFHRFSELFGVDNLSLKLTASYNRFNSELPISRSLASVALLQYDPASALRYNPVAEVNSFAGIKPVEHREFQAGFECNLANKFNLSGHWFNRQIRHDVFPWIQNNIVMLANMAGHYKRGIELQAEYNQYSYDKNKLSYNSLLSFVSYTSKITSVAPGFEQQPMAGFSTVHTALVKGEPLGVILGNRWLRNADQKIMIGNDGFPVADNQLSVLGNTLPDFIMKMSHKLRYKTWDLLLDIEWKKGGECWNGTEAMLDYYGRSAGTAEQRTISNYVFPGIMANGSHNTIPVSFYDPALPFSQNKWVRYGPTGVTEDYIQQGDMLRISSLSLSWKPVINRPLQQLSFTLYVTNLLLWSPYEGVDTNQQLYDQSGTQGLDFFNLPAQRSAGITMALQF
ncbi:MAG: hypothetical protein J0M10_16260 [Chitinophagales bacterium]|nr:hypothetical protein [Chitinophagales bacterium]